MVAGIIVSYQPNPEELIIHINELLEEVDIILLIENGSNKTIQVELENKLQNTKIEILRLTENEGLARAQNIAIKRGMEIGVDYFLFLDDDSEIGKGSVKLLQEELEKNPTVGIVSCHIEHKDSDKKQKYWIKRIYLYHRVQFTESIHRLENVNTVISSGTLIPRRVIEKCGLMQDEYFIDYVDIEYCLRVRANGYSITVLQNAKLFHKLGNTRSIRFGFFRFHLTNHSPKRRYYMIRNRIWTWRKYAFTFPGWLLLDIGNFLADNVRVFIFEKNKWEKGKFFWKGVVDGVFRKAERR